MLRRGRYCTNGTRLFPDIHAPKWAFRVYNYTLCSVIHTKAANHAQRAERGCCGELIAAILKSFLIFFNVFFFFSKITGVTGYKNTTGITEPVHCQLVLVTVTGSGSEGPRYSLVRGPVIGGGRLRTGILGSDLGFLLLFGGCNSDWRRWFTFKLGRPQVPLRPQQRPRWLFWFTGR